MRHMFDFAPSLESPIKFEKKSIIVDSNQFTVCTTKINEINSRKKTRLVYAHHDGKMLHLTIVDPISGEVILKS